jgi:hypothetical protein
MDLEHFVIWRMYISTPISGHLRWCEVTADPIFEVSVVTLPIQCSTSDILCRILTVLYTREFIYRGWFSTISTPAWGQFRWCEVTADPIYEFLLVILPIQCASSSTLSLFLRVVYRREFLYRTRVLVISTPSWGHFRSHWVTGDPIFDLLVAILPIHPETSSTLFRFLRVVYRRQFLYIVGLSDLLTNGHKATEAKLIFENP